MGGNVQTTEGEGREDAFGDLEREILREHGSRDAKGQKLRSFDGARGEGMRKVKKGKRKSREKKGKGKGH